MPPGLAGRLRATRVLTTDPEQATLAMSQLEVLIGDRAAPTPMVRLVEEAVIDQLLEHPDFTDRVAEDVSTVARSVIRYVAHRLGTPADFMRANYGGGSIVEQDLADDFERWLGAAPLSRGSVTIEVRRIGGGRADVLIGFGTHRVIIELKRELADASHDALEAHYAGQAASYQSTDYPFGIVLVLDLSAEQTGALAHLRDLVWTSEVAAPGVTRRKLVWCVVPGRRVTPSALSR